MHGVSQYRRACRLCRRPLLAIVTAVLCAASLVAQKAPAGDAALKYDPHNEVKLKATVEEMKLPATDKQAVHLLVKVGSDTADVYLCPKSFLDDMGLTFAKGDEIEITGSKVKQDTTELILAREIAKGNDTLVLRDPTGAPVWSWHR